MCKHNQERQARETFNQHLVQVNIRLDERG